MRYKGANRRMFREPGLARQAIGILASSRELMNEAQPMRMSNGGDVSVPQSDFIVPFGRGSVSQSDFIVPFGRGSVSQPDPVTPPTVLEYVGEIPYDVQQELNKRTKMPMIGQEEEVPYTRQPPDPDYVNALRSESSLYTDIISEFERGKLGRTEYTGLGRLTDTSGAFKIQDVIDDWFEDNPELGESYLSYYNRNRDDPLSERAFKRLLENRYLESEILGRRGIRAINTSEASTTSPFLFSDFGIEEDFPELSAQRQRQEKQIQSYQSELNERVKENRGDTQEPLRMANGGIASIPYGGIFSPNQPILRPSPDDKVRDRISKFVLDPLLRIRTGVEVPRSAARNVLGAVPKFLTTPVEDLDSLDVGSLFSTSAQAAPTQATPTQATPTQATPAQAAPAQAAPAPKAPTSEPPETVDPLTTRLSEQERSLVAPEYEKFLQSVIAGGGSLEEADKNFHLMVFGLTAAAGQSDNPLVNLATAARESLINYAKEKRDVEKSSFVRKLEASKALANLRLTEQSRKGSLEKDLEYIYRTNNLDPRNPQDRAKAQSIYQGLQRRSTDIQNLGSLTAQVGAAVEAYNNKARSTPDEVTEKDKASLRSKIREFIGTLQTANKEAIALEQFDLEDRLKTAGITRDILDELGIFLPKAEATN